MILENIKYRSVTVNINNKNIEFGKDGTAEVDDELGKFAIENFPKKYWEKGKKPAPEKVVKTNEGDTEEVVKLKIEIERLEGIIVEKNKRIAKEQAAVKLWQDEFNKLNGSLKSDEAEETSKEGLPEGYDEYVDEMKKKNFAALKKGLIDSEFITEDKIKEENISTRDGLIDYVVKNRLLG